MLLTSTADKAAGDLSARERRQRAETNTSEPTKIMHNDAGDPNPGNDAEDRA